MAFFFFLENPTPIGLENMLVLRRTKCELKMDSEMSFRFDLYGSNWITLVFDCDFPIGSSVHIFDAIGKQQIMAKGLLHANANTV